MDENLKDLFIKEGEQLSSDTLEELSNGRGEDDE